MPVPFVSPISSLVRQRIPSNTKFQRDFYKQVFWKQAWKVASFRRGGGGERAPRPTPTPPPPTQEAALPLKNQPRKRSHSASPGPSRPAHARSPPKLKSGTA